jgi:hypothetical protein
MATNGNRMRVLPDAHTVTIVLRMTGAPEHNAGLKLLNQITRSNAKSLGDFQQIIHRRRFDSPFDSADERRGEVGFLRQLLLTESGFFCVWHGLSHPKRGGVS